MVDHIKVIHEDVQNSLLENYENYMYLQDIQAKEIWSLQKVLVQPKSKRCF